jgi:hypothetical protein
MSVLGGDCYSVDLGDVGIGRVSDPLRLQFYNFDAIGVTAHVAPVLDASLPLENSSDIEDRIGEGQDGAYLAGITGSLIDTNMERIDFKRYDNLVMYPPVSNWDIESNADSVDDPENIFDNDYSNFATLNVSALPLWLVAKVKNGADWLQRFVIESQVEDGLSAFYPTDFVVEYALNDYALNSAPPGSSGWITLHTVVAGLYAFNTIPVFLDTPVLAYKVRIWVTAIVGGVANWQIRRIRWEAKEQFDVDLGVVAATSARDFVLYINPQRFSRFHSVESVAGKVALFEARAAM